ncbi:MAG: VOC family protein [Brevefilum sp.]|nr:VOC family protein [Brevefilum sp.]
MKLGVEIDFVVEDCLKACALYEKIFDVEPVEMTNYATGMNEVVFTLYGSRFHMLDENPEFQLIAPKPGDPKPIWFNISVLDIASTYAKAINQGCTEIQPVTEMPDFGVSNAIFSDPFGYLWMLHQVHKEVSFEERKKLWEDREE